MRAIETTAIITEDGKLIAEVPPDVGPGHHRVVIVVEQEQTAAGPDDLSDFPVHDSGPWPEGLSLRREDMYDDWGR
jgi:hypothetical protein